MDSRIIDMTEEECEELMHQAEVLKKLALNYKPNINIDTIIRNMESRVKEFKNKKK